MLSEILNELLLLLKYDEFKIYYITATSLLAFILLRYFMRGNRYDKTTRCDGKVILITGGNTGIGKATAAELAARGGKVYIACRSIERGEQARNEIVKRTRNQNVFVRQLDLASFDSIRKFCIKFSAEESRLDILINNAGAIAMTYTKTADGLELTMGVNHFGHFLLTNLLLPILKKSQPSRIINVSSLAHRFGKIGQDNLSCSEKSFNSSNVYADSKLANILFTRELSKRLEDTKVTVNSLHPGVINTDILRNMNERGGFMRLLHKFLIKPSQALFLKTPLDGSQTTLFAALDPTLKNVTGQYFSNCKIASIAKPGRDDEAAAWLWNVSEKWTKLNSKNPIRVGRLDKATDTQMSGAGKKTVKSS